ncbi:MAG: GGDEF domain-containing protein [Schwartzia sp.]|nr:GGDEF domain-containing protein [Schwartzia sp. (in: firmicutes)]
MKKFFSAVFSLFFVLTFCLSVVRAEEVPDAVRTIRVGLVEQPGEQNGFAYEMLLSYIRAYLDEVSKQTRWRYEYESGSYQDCLERLRRGELNFMGPVQPGPTVGGMVFTAGIPNWTLLHLYQRGDAPAQPFTSETAQNAVVGVIANDANLTALSFFMTLNEWDITVRTFHDVGSLMAALRDGEIDAVCDDGSHVGEEGRYAATVGVVPSRLMTTPDKEDLCRQLTEAILTIESLTPGFGTSQKGKYVDRALQTIVLPTEGGRRYVENAGELRVAFLADCAPFYEIGDGDKETASGLYVDMLKLLSEGSGLRFAFCRAESEARLWDMLALGEADLAFVSYMNGGPAMDMYFTGDVREEEFSVIRRKDGKMEPSAKNVAVVPAGFPGAEYYFSKTYNQQVHTLKSPEECLKAVEKGLYETAYIPTLYLRRESSIVVWPDLERLDREATTLPLSLAMSPKQPRVLQNVLNTAILRMDRNEVERLVHENARPRFSLEYLLYRYPLWTTLFICALVLGLAVLFFMLYRHRLQMRQNEILQKKNRDLEDALRREEAMRISRDGYKLESEMDQLTAVYNKMSFENEVRTRLAAMPEGGVGAFYIMDLDYFKAANDTYGHQVGDEILQKFSAALKEVFRQSDCIGRFGGDEFVVFIAGELTRGAVEQKARRVLELVRDITVENTDIKITASIGVAMYPEHGTGYDYLFNAADRALYYVKSEGRDGYSVASSEVVR